MQPVTSAAVLCAAWIGVAWPARADPHDAALLQAEGQSLQASCNGGDAQVEGNHNVIILTGACHGLSLNGVANRVTIELSDGATVHIEGSANRVTYRLSASAAPAAGAPVVVALGPDNLVGPEALAVSMPAVAAAPIRTPPKPAAGPMPASRASILDLAGDDQERLVDCRGRDVRIHGARSAYILRGGCHSLTVAGNLDTVQAEMAAGGQISIEGNGTTVAWALLGPGGAPVAKVHGVDSRSRRTGMIGGQPVPGPRPPVATHAVAETAGVLDSPAQESRR